MERRWQFSTVWLLIILILAAFLTRIWGLGDQSLWFDEAWSAYAASQPTIIGAANADATNPPLYYVLLNIYTAFAGDTEFALRLFSLFLGVLTLPMVYQLGRRLFDKRVALAGVMVCAFLPLLWWASREARMYTLIAVLALICGLAFDMLVKKPSRGAWLLLWGGELALLYAHNTGPIVILWLNALVAAAWLSRRSMAQPSWRAWLLGQIIVIALWTPYFALRFVQLPEANSALAQTIELSASFFFNLWQALWITPWERVVFAGENLLLLILLLMWFAVCLPYRKVGTRWLAIHALVWIGGIILGLFLLRNEIHGRYLVVAAPFICVLLGAALLDPRHMWIRALGAVLPLAAFAVNFAYNADPAFRRDDARGMVRYYADQLGADDTVLAWSYADRYDLAYYWEREGVAARRVTLAEGADFEEIASLLPTSGNVALNIWYTQRGDYRGMLDCLLSSGTTQPPEEYTVFGMSSRLYRHPALVYSQSQPISVEILAQSVPIAHLTAVGTAPEQQPHQAACIPIQMRVLAPIQTELKAAVIALNYLGQEIARADAPFATANQRTTEAVENEELLTAYPLLRLPLGSPAGDYEIRLRVYDQQQMSGYPLVSQTNDVVGRDLVIGHWTALVGADWSEGDYELDLPVEFGARVDDLTLIAHDLVPSNEPLRNGDILRFTLLWESEPNTPLPTLYLTYPNGESVADIPPVITSHDGITRDWRQVTIPLEVSDGILELRLPDGTNLASFEIETQPPNFVRPEVDQELNMVFAGIGELVGVNDLSPSLSLDQPPQFELIWRGGAETSSTNYTVFVQLLDSAGLVIAQSDAVPAQGERPVTGWRPGEYILDLHTLAYNERATDGNVSLIVGLYDPISGQRAVLEDGSDYVFVKSLEILPEP